MGRKITAIKNWARVAVGTVGAVGSLAGPPAKAQEVYAQQQKAAAVERRAKIQRDSEIATRRRPVATQPVNPGKEQPTRIASPKPPQRSSKVVRRVESQQPPQRKRSRDRDR